MTTARRGLRPVTKRRGRGTRRGRGASAGRACGAASAGRADRADRADRGSSAVELVIITPVLIAVIFGLVQTALVWHARHVAAATAQQGARLARASGGQRAAAGRLPAGSVDLVDGQIRDNTLRYLQRLGGQLLSHPQVSIRRSGLDVTVTVTGLAVGVLPGTSITVAATSRTPVERFRP